MRKLLLLLLIALIAIQFIRPEKNISTTVSPTDIANKYTVPAEVAAVLKRSCNDCHSNNTNYPWYSNIQPLTWWLNDHIKDGKRHLNFSNFTAYSYKRQDHKLEEVTESIEKHEMPLPSYTSMHAEAKLSEADKKLLASWVTAVRTEIRKDTTLPALK
ncbi:heme-binding domain-containing protein [Pseudoflavitalea sp. G-6-1-2]|uniref:heme-binding domain-containing protein n=1 Tax=Pseudoflavitalea sp. G-6-1-2 TaxID=2728841 RepID=UPI00146B1A5F|nr:heme-binding domain-containing protein [Pseudoflavitalea sp. G-6-1-2]NML22067.1 heme-binding domain-containing protein [Pseudoflavitalea sp. G-6-1-2]